MKFDTPATTNPIDRMKVDRQAASTASTARSRPRGTAPYAYERHDVAPNQAYG